MWCSHTRVLVSLWQIKLNNIILSSKSEREQPVPKFIDFGMAKGARSSQAGLAVSALLPPWGFNHTPSFIENSACILSQCVLDFTHSYRPHAG